MPSDRYLAIETSSPRLSLAIGDASKTIASVTGRHDWRHAEILFEELEKLLSRARWPVQTLSGVAVSVGPGSFTGIRIGLAVARSLGQSLKIPVIGISSLEAMAAGAKTRARWLAPRIDALRGQVFAALFERTSTGVTRRRLPDAMVFPDVWITEVKKMSVDGSLWISPLLGCYPEARVLLDLARPRFSGANRESYRSVLPVYIRQAAAQERRK